MGRFSGSALASHADSGGSRVYCIDGNNHVREFGWLGAWWIASDLTSTTGAPAAAAGSALASHDSGGSRVYFTDADNHVHELASLPSGWNTTDLTSTTGAPAAAAGSALASHADSGGSRVYFTDGNNHVHEFGWLATGWIASDLTSTTGAPAAAAGSALASHDFSGSRVYCIDANDHVRELASLPSGWNTTDLNIQLQPNCWMKGVDGSAYLSQLSIPGTHDTLTFNSTPVAQDQDNSFDIAAQLNAGIRIFDLRLAWAWDRDSADLLVGWHGGYIADTEFWQYVLAPTIQFLQTNPTECVIYVVTDEGDPPQSGPGSMSWDQLVSDYLVKYSPGDRTWNGFDKYSDVPTLDQVRGMIVMADGSDSGNGAFGGLNFTGWPYNSWGTDGKGAPVTIGPVNFYVQNIYDDQSGKADRSVEGNAIQDNIKAAAANTDPRDWYITFTNRANGVPSSRAFALGWAGQAWPLDPGYNQVALGQINQVPLTADGRDQQTVGVVASDFPNDTDGYIQAIYNHNSRINQVPLTGGAD